MLPRITGLSLVEDNVPHFSNVEELANSNSERFLIGGTKRLTGLQINSMSPNHLDHSERHIFPGELFTREKIYFGETKKKSRLFRKPKYIIEKFLMCRDEMDNQLLLPFNVEGIFYQVSHTGGKACKNVLQMSDIVARKMTPRLIKLVYGRFPVTPSSFTGLMKAESSDIETSVIACTLMNKENILLELPVHSAMYFRIALTNDSLRLNPWYRNAISLCAERASTYMRNIKVCVNIQDDDYDTIPDDFITKRNRSNSFDIEAVPSIPRKTSFSSMKRSYGSLKRPTGHKGLEVFTRTSSDQSAYESQSSLVNLRPGRCYSTGRMSFCLGNSCLTVPLYDSNSPQKRDSGNNNSIHQFTFSHSAGSRISFNGKFLEEDTSNEEKDDQRHEEDLSSGSSGSASDVAPPPPCTSMSTYVNLIEPPTLTSDSDMSDYIPASGNRRPSSNAPETAPPPVPVSVCTNTESTVSISSSAAESDVKKEGSKSFEYAVPKKKDDSNDSASKSETKATVTRRPSTFTFSEGCMQFRSMKGSNSSLTPVEIDFEDDCPIYENIKTLMEAVNAKEKLFQETANVTELYNVMESAEEDDQPKEQISLFISEVNDCIDNDKLELDSGKDVIGDFSPYTEGFCKPDIDISDKDNEKCEVKDIEPEFGAIEKRCRKLAIVNENLICPIQEVESTSIDMKEGRNETFPDELEHLSDRRNNRSPTNEPIKGFADVNEIQPISGIKKTPENEIRVPGQQNPCFHEDIKRMSGEMILEAFKLIGIKEATLRKVSDLEIDGNLLCDILHGEKPMNECLTGINLVDQQKISMFIRGWRPDMDYM